MVPRVKLLGPEDRDAAASSWTALDAREGVGSLTTRWPWTEIWLDHFGAEVPHWFAIAEQAGEPVGAGLLTLSGDRLRGRTLHLGTAGEPTEATVFVEHNTLHTVAGNEQAFAEGLLAAAREAGSWDRIALDGFKPDAASVVTAVNGETWHVAPQGCPTTDLELVRQAGGDVLDVLSGSRRSRARRSLRAIGDVETEWCEDPAGALAALDELAELNCSRWEAIGEHTPFSDPRFVAFHRDLIARLAPAGDAWIFRVRDAEGTLASVYCLREGSRVLFYQSGMRATTDNRVRPGLAAHVLSINACAERGFDVYDFLAPPTRYKQELATGEEQLVWATRDRPSLLTPLRDAARSALRRARRNGS